MGHQDLHEKTRIECECAEGETANALFAAMQHLHKSHASIQIGQVEAPQIEFHPVTQELKRITNAQVHH